MEIRSANVSASDIVKDTTTANFMKDVIEASRSVLVLVDFWANWCGPCKQLGPVLEKVVKSYGGTVRLVKLDTDAHPSIAAQLRVQSLPTVYAFRDGRPLDGFVGVQPESMLRQFIDRLLGDGEGGEAAPGLADILAAAEEALEAGDLQGAADAFSAVLQEDQGNADALAGLARCYVKSGDTERAQQMLALVPPDKETNAAVLAVKAALELSAKAAGSGETSALEERIAKDPADHQARYDLAVALAASGNKGEALEHLLTIVRRNRTWNDEAARKQLVQLFEVWGPKDESTIEGRKRLSSILFA
ncbi:MAG: thioredoxin [Hyphomicrobium sp.]|jgi:putative thioredoxin|nr:thioredoxin [Hyphomicrobium sp.]